MSGRRNIYTAWTELNRKLASAPILEKRYDGKSEIAVATDASKESLEAVVLQQDSKGEFKTIVYLSTKFSSAVLDYPMWE